MPNGYQISLACGPLKRARYINTSIEEELAEFKEEISGKHAKSEMNKTYVFQRTANYVYQPKSSKNFKAVTQTLPRMNASSGVPLVQEDEDDDEDYDDAEPVVMVNNSRE